ncbi:MAG: hypothetical protein L3J03_00270 [Desulfobacterales bacterium]|nr:hypothetical protein [Desulfobacterales bacterium]
MLRVQEIIHISQGKLLALRNDPEGIPVLRTLVLALALCLCAYYVGHAFILEPKQKKIKQETALKNQLLQSSPGRAGRIMTTGIHTMEEQIRSLKDGLAVNLLKERILTRQWRILGDEQEFNNSVFTLQPSTPVKINDNLQKVRHLEPETRDAFTIYPVRIEGNTDFTTLYNYLLHLEESPPVSMIDDLVIENRTAGKDKGDRPLHFILKVGRIGLKTGPAG